MRAVPGSSCLRPAVVVTVGAVLLSMVTALPARAEEQPAAGDVVVGELIQGYADPGPHDEHESAEHAGPGLLSWIRTAPGEAVRVSTEDLGTAAAGATAGATVEVTVGEAVEGEALASGLEPAREVLAAEVLAVPEQPVAAATTDPVNHPVTVVMVQPADAAAQRAADSTTLSDVVAEVDGPVAEFWRTQSGGTVRFGVAASVDWVVSDATCRDPFGLWQDAATASSWAGALAEHLFVYVPENSPDCAYGLGTVGRSLDDGGLAYAQSTATSVLAHELGHNLGLGHSSARLCDAAVDSGSCEVAPYRDYYDVMGVSWDNLGTLSTTQAALIGVLPQADVVDLTTASGTASYTLSPVSVRTGTRALRLTAGDGRTYWLEYRLAGGQDSWLGDNSAGVESGVLLRRGGSQPDTSLLLDGTPSATSGWSTDTLYALALGQPVTVAGGAFTVTVESTGDTASVRVQSRPADVLDPGERLPAGQGLTSANGRYRAVFQSDGNLVVYAWDGRVLWASGIRHPGATASLLHDGNLVIGSESGVLWQSRTGGNPGARLVMQNDGNLVLYRATGSAEWWTGWDTPDRLRAGQILTGGQQLISPNGRYRMVYQSDGNAVVYAWDGRALWASDSYARGGWLTMQTDGNLVSYAAGRPIWHSATWGYPGAQLILQNDGNLVLYRVDGRPLWWTGWDTPDRLRPGQQLFTGQALTSPNGAYRAVAQADGNVVVYSSGGRVVWASYRYGSGVRLVQQGDGNLVGYDGTGRAIWDAGTWRHPGAVTALRDDGSLVVHAGGKIVWRTASDGQRQLPGGSG